MVQRAMFTVCALALAALEDVAGQGADSAAFIIRLGRDTTAIERYVRTPNRLVAEAVSRSPTTSLHRLTLDFGANGAVTGGEYTVQPPGSSAPATRRVIAFRGDSVQIDITQGTRTQTQRAATGEAIPLSGPFYAPYELAIMRALATRRPSVNVLPGTAPVAVNVQRVGTDSVALNNQFDEPMRAHIDARGRILHLQTPAFATVTRVRWVDLDALARDFSARDQTGKSLGVLSPRMTLRRSINGANLWLDYGRPAMRGRPVWGALVPWNEVWRMGANDATHFSTDRTLEIGSLTIAPGTYTLFLKPGPNGWVMTINRQTGMSGLDYDDSVDLGDVPLQVSPLATPVEWFTIDLAPAQQGGVLTIAWDRTQATVPFRIR